MTTNLERVYWNVARLTKLHTAEVDALFERIKEETKDDVEANLPVTNVDMNRRQVDWASFDVDDLEIPYYYTFEIRGEWFSMTEDERCDTLEKLEDELNDADTGEERRAELEEDVETIEQAAVEYTELMWNTAWQPYGDSVDRELIDRIPGVTWVGIEGEDWITLTTIGMDMGPSLMAYVALAHQAIDREHVHYLTGDLEWCRYVIGDKLTLEVADALGVKRQIAAAMTVADSRKNPTYPADSEDDPA